MHPRALSTLLVLPLVLLCSATNATECTDSEATYAESVWAAAAANLACLPYVTMTDPVYVSAPCTATDCVAVVEGVAEDLPDCTYSGINNKIEVQNALTSCNGGDTEDAGALTAVTDAPTTSTTTSTSPPTSTSTTDCTTDEYQSTEDLYDAAAATDACSPYSTSSSILVSVYAPCSATDCLNVMTQLAADLPDCLYEGSNQKAELTDNLSVCTDDTTGEVDSSTPVASSSESSALTPTPTSTASSTSCTTSEANDMWDMYTTTAESDECAADSTIDIYSIYIFTTCGSDCAKKIKDLAEELPNCYYDYELMNKKQDVLDELDDCGGISSYISITVFPDSSIEVASSSASTATPAASSGSSMIASGDDTTFDSSGAGATETSSSPPRASAGLLELCATSSLLAGVILAF